MFLNIPKGAGSCLLIITILSRTHTARHFGEHSGRELGILGGERSLEMHAPRLLGGNLGALGGNRGCRVSNRAANSSKKTRSSDNIV